MPVLLAKLWSVIPRLFVWPPAATPAQAVERAAVGLLVASTIFLFATGIANMQYWYVFDFDFVQAHYYAAVIFVGALVVHLVVKLPVAARAYRSRGVLAPLRQGLAETRQEPRDDELVAAQPEPPTVSRRGLLAAVGAGSAALLVVNVGQSVGGPLRSVAVLAPRRDGGFPVNKTAAAAGDHARARRPRVPARAGVRRPRDRARPRRAARAPAGDAHADARLRRGLVDAADLDRRPAARAGAPGGDRRARRAAGRLAAAAGRAAAGDARGRPGRGRALAARAERRTARTCSPDHGYPARIIVPGLPGVHNTKWVGRLEFRA